MGKKKPIKKSTTTSTDKSKQDLSTIEMKLLKYAEEGKSVFLYGKNSIELKALVRNIGKDIFKKRRFINCRKMDGEEIYEKLTNSDNGVLLKYEGLLFLNNLYCESKTEEDFNYYNKLTKFIRKYDVAVKWLVVYALNRKNFPLYFRKQFKVISLENTTKEKAVKEKNRMHRIPNNKFKQLVKEVKRECPIRLGITFFKELSKMSKSNKYDPTGKGYTPLTAKKRYYEVLPSK